jgi:hypothetical protein
VSTWKELNHKDWKPEHAHAYLESAEAAQHVDQLSRAEEYLKSGAAAKHVGMLEKAKNLLGSSGKSRNWYGKKKD